MAPTGAPVRFWRLSELGVLEHPRLSLVEHDLTDLGNQYSSLQATEPAGSTTWLHKALWACPSISHIPPQKLPRWVLLNLLEAIRIVNPRIRYYQASTSEMFGKVQEVPQRESTPSTRRSLWRGQAVCALDDH